MNLSAFLRQCLYFDNSSNVGFVEFLFPMFALILLHFITLLFIQINFLFAVVGLFFLLSALSLFFKLHFYGISTCMTICIQCAQYSQYVKIALTIHSNCLIYQCKGAAMEERERRHIHIHNLYYMFKIHKREHGMKQQQQHHRTHRLNSTIDQE